MKEIICTLNKEGFRAHYYPGNKEPEKAIISVGGGKCDEKTSIAMSRFLRNAGWNVLVLGYYLWKGLPQSESGIPIDYCEKAVNWLKKEQGIKKIAMTGASFGGSYTLTCASLLPDITCIIPIVPYDYILEGTKNSKPLHCSIYHFHGKDLPYTSADIPNITMPRIIRIATRLKEYGLSRYMRLDYDYFEGAIKPIPSVEKDLQMLNYNYKEGCLNPDSRIKVENMNADVLLLAVENDDCWPSEVATRRIVERLKESGYRKKVEWHIYEKGSHMLVDGFNDEVSFIPRLLLKTMIPAEKKYPKECEEARQDSFKKILKFLEDWQ